MSMYIHATFRGNPDEMDVVMLAERLHALNEIVISAIEQDNSDHWIQATLVRNSLQDELDRMGVDLKVEFVESIRRYVLRSFD